MNESILLTLDGRGKEAKREALLRDRAATRQAVLAEVWGLMMDAVSPGKAPNWSGFVDRISALRRETK